LNERIYKTSLTNLARVIDRVVTNEPINGPMKSACGFKTLYAPNLSFFFSGLATSNSSNGLISL